MNFGGYYGYQPPGAYGPSGAMPDNLTQMRGQYQPAPPQTQQGNGLIWVQGEGGAKSFLVGPGQNVLLMDSENSRFYLKSADNSGMPLPLRTFEYTEVGAAPRTAAPSSNDQFITREEFEERIAQLNKFTDTKEDTNNE